MDYYLYFFKIIFKFFINLPTNFYITNNNLINFGNI